MGWKDELTDVWFGRINASSAAPSDGAQIRFALSGSTAPWRPPLTKHTREEIKFDLIKRIEGTFSRTGSLSRATTALRIDSTALLTGNPLITLRLSSPNNLITPSFHPCVRIRPWNKEKILEFLPPDGRFTLAHFSPSYQPVPTEVQAEIPFTLRCLLRTTERNKVEFRLDLESLPGAGKQGYGRLAENAIVSQLVLSFHVPEDTREMDCSLFCFGPTGSKKNEEAGVWLYDPKLRVVRWALGSIQPGRTVRMRGSYGTTGAVGKPASNVGVQFTVVHSGSHSGSLPGAQLLGVECVNVGGSDETGMGMTGFGSTPEKARGTTATRPVSKGVRHVLMADLEYRWN